MRTASILAALSFAATTFAQAVEIGIEPSSPVPEGCDKSPKGNFTIGYLPAASVLKKKRETAIADADGSLYLTLKDGVLTDGWSRTGSVVANHQFQFDGPPQAGAIYTGGFSVCQNNSLAIGGTTRWWNCRSGDFYNLYDEWIGAQCEEIRILAKFVDQPASSSSSAVASSTTKSSTSTRQVHAPTLSQFPHSKNVTAPTPSQLTPTLSVIPLTSINGTEPSGSVTRVSSAISTPTPTSSESGTPEAPNSGASAPSTVSRGATFGAVVGILAAALIL